MSLPPTNALRGPFRSLAWANLAAQSAEQISLAAAPMIAVLALGAGPGETGFLAAAQTLPFLLLSIPAGLLADRYPRQRLMVGAEGVRAVSLVALLLAAVSGHLSIAGLALLGFCGAAGTVAFSVAAPALVPAIVPREALQAANSRLELARSCAFAAGPALAGALVAWAGASAAFVVATLLSVAALGWLMRLPATPLNGVVRRHVLLELQEGARFVWHHRLLRPIALVTVAWNIAWYVLQATYVPYAVRHLGLDTAGIGSTLATYGVGLVVGAVMAPWWLKRLRLGVALSVGPIVSLLGALVMLSTLWFADGRIAALAYLLLGLSAPLWTVAQITLRQTLTPGPLLGRVSALFMTAGAGARPIGAAIGGMAGEAFGLSSAISVTALFFVLQAAVVMASPLVALRRLPEVP